MAELRCRTVSVPVFVRADVLEPLGEVRQRAEERAEPYGHRDADAALHLGDDVQIDLLDLCAGEVRIGRQVVDVQLQRVRASLLDVRRVLRSATRGVAVQATNDGDRQRLLGRLDVAGEHRKSFPSRYPVSVSEERVDHDRRRRTSPRRRAGWRYSLMPSNTRFSALGSP